MICKAFDIFFSRVKQIIPGVLDAFNDSKHLLLFPKRSEQTKLYAINIFFSLSGPNYCSLDNKTYDSTKIVS